MKETEITIKIKCKWGSDYQHDMGINALSVMMAAWNIYCSKSHKKNEINTHKFYEKDTNTKKRQKSKRMGESKTNFNKGGNS